MNRQKSLLMVWCKEVTKASGSSDEYKPKFFEIVFDILKNLGLFQEVDVERRGQRS